jgi:hypothetical protein
MPAMTTMTAIAAAGPTAAKGTALRTMRAPIATVMQTALAAPPSMAIVAPVAAA